MFFWFFWVFFLIFLGEKGKKKAPIKKKCFISRARPRNNTFFFNWGLFLIFFLIFLKNPLTSLPPTWTGVIKWGPVVKNTSSEVKLKKLAATQTVRASALVNVRSCIWFFKCSSKILGKNHHEENMEETKHNFKMLSALTARKFKNWNFCPVYRTYLNQKKITFLFWNDALKKT